MAADPAVSPVDFLAAELCSAVAHVGWRFKVGAPTLLMPLSLLVAMGAVLLLSATTEAFTLLEQIVSVVMVAAISAVTIAEMRFTAATRPLPLRVAWLVAAALTLAKAVILFTNPKVPAEQLSGIGGAVIAFGFFMSAVRTSMVVRPPLMVVTIGTGLLSAGNWFCLLYTSPSPRDRTRSRMPSSA